MDAPSGIGIGTDLLQAGYGLDQLIQGNKLLKTPIPQRVVDPNVLYNQQLSRSIASEGLPDSTKNAYTENINRALGSGINAILEGGGDINMISKLVGGATDAYKKVLGEDAEQKLANQGQLMQANQNVANEDQANFNWNQAEPFLRKYAMGAQQTNAGAQNIFSGLRGVGGALGGGSGGGSSSSAGATSGATAGSFSADAGSTDLSILSPDLIAGLV